MNVERPGWMWMISSARARGADRRDQVEGWEDRAAAAVVRPGLTAQALDRPRQRALAERTELGHARRAGERHYAELREELGAAAR
jgi:hypothetical protein